MSRMLHAKDAAAVSRIGEIALESNDLNRLRKETLELLPSVLDVERSFFFLARHYPSQKIDIDTVVSAGIEEKYLTLYREHYYKVDPVFNGIDISRTLERVTDVITYANLMRGEFYKDFLMPQGLHFAFGINLKIGNRLLGVVRLTRGKFDRDFTEDDMAKAELIAPYLAAAIEKASLVEKARKTEKIIGAISRDARCTGILVVDESLSPIYANGGARKTLGMTGDGSVSEEAFVTLPDEVYAQCERLFQSPDYALEPQNSRKCNFTVRIGKQDVPVNVSLITDSPGSRLCLVLIGQRKAEETVSAHARELGLTPRESEIACLVAQGLTNNEVAQRLFISEYTVENHLKSIREKLAVRNRTTLAHKVMQLTS